MRKPESLRPSAESAARGGQKEWEAHGGRRGARRPCARDGEAATLRHGTYSLAACGGAP